MLCVPMIADRKAGSPLGVIQFINRLASDESLENDESMGEAGDEKDGVGVGLAVDSDDEADAEIVTVRHGALATATAALVTSFTSSDLKAAIGFAAAVGRVLAHSAGQGKTPLSRRSGLGPAGGAGGSEKDRSKYLDAVRFPISQV
jgi:hypothetical protein